MAAVVSDQDRVALRRALELADGGRGRVSPNPLVGAIVMRDGETIGEGFHAELGGLHAETAALADCRARGHDPAGATMYVTLEPCAHQGRQPPCADALVEAGLGRVVIASEDPSEKASGRGPRLLRDSGIQVTFADGPEAAAARRLNQPFRKHARTGLPHVTLKSAVTIDGRTATAGGDSHWISGSESRRLVHRWRAESDAVAVGIGTVLRDDPLLTARDVEATRQPTRVVFDSGARLPLSSKLVTSVADAPLIAIVGSDAPADRVAALREAGAEVIEHGGDGEDRIAAALGRLGERGITSLLLEGGARLAGAFLDANEVDDIRVFVAPLLVGGAEAFPLAAGRGAATIAEATRALAMDWQASGDDVLIRARLREW